MKTGKKEGSKIYNIKENINITNKNNFNNNIKTDNIENNNFVELKNLLLRTSNEEKENDNYQEKSSLLLENIMAILEKISLTLKGEKKLFDILKEIYTTINLLIKEFKCDLNNAAKINTFITESKKDNKESIDFNINEGNNLIEFDINSKVVFLLKIKTLNRKINSLNEELNCLKQLFKDPNDKLNRNKSDNFYKFFTKKLKQINLKTKCDEFKYLLYIQNQKKKIMDLEEKLNIKKHENLSKEVLKSIRCFPNFVQYNFKEDINPKSLPLSEFLQMETNKNNKKRPKSTKNIKKSLSFKNKYQIHPIHTQNINTDRKLSRPKTVRINGKIKTEINIQNNNNNYFKNSRTFYKNKSHKINFKSLIDKDNHKRNYQSINPQKISTKFIIDKNIIKEVREFNPKTLMSNEKEFFIAHPTLDIAGISKGKDQAYIGLPKKFLKLNRGGAKSARIVFPSSLNETMVNLEKLRINKLIDMKNNDGE